MNYAKLSFAIATLLLLGGMLPANVLAGPAPCTGPLTVKQAHRALHAAHRAVVRAKAAEREARDVLRATRTYSACYGDNVGRWIRLARRAGWGWPEMGQLCYIINRESGGDPNAKNPVSSASGLMQFLSGWWAGKWNPFDPYQSLRHAYLAWLQVGFAPWAL